MQLSVGHQRNSYLRLEVVLRARHHLVCASSDSAAVWEQGQASDLDALARGGRCRRPQRRPAAVSTATARVDESGVCRVAHPAATAAFAATVGRRVPALEQQRLGARLCLRVRGEIMGLIIIRTG
jgi:hypothetical protein